MWLDLPVCLFRAQSSGGPTWCLAPTPTLPTLMIQIRQVDQGLCIRRMGEANLHRSAAAGPVLVLILDVTSSRPGCHDAILERRLQDSRGSIVQQLRVLRRHGRGAAALSGEERHNDIRHVVQERRPKGARLLKLVPTRQLPLKSIVRQCLNFALQVVLMLLQSVCHTACSYRRRRHSMRMCGARWNVRTCMLSSCTM